jgi:capsular exopolysaccharide synthesis family protein
MVMRLEHAGRLPMPALPPIELPSSEEEVPRHLGDYLGALRRNFRLAAACFLLVFALTVIVTFLMPRRYSAATRIQVGLPSAIQLRLENNVISLDDSDRTDRGAISFVGTQSAVLSSRDLAERVVRTYALDRSPAFVEPAKHRDGPLPVTTETSLRPRGLEVGPKPALGGEDATRPIAPEMLDRYLRYLSIKNVQGTDLIDVGFVTPSPALSAFLSAEHTQAYLEANEDARRATDVAAQKFLGRKIATARKNVKRAEGAMARFAAHHSDVAVNEEQHVGGQRIADLSSLLTKAAGERLALESRYEFLSSPHADPLAYFLDRPAVERLRLSLLDVRAQKASFDERLGANHPHMVELTRLESEIDKQLKAEVSRGVDSVRSQYDASKQAEDRLRKQLELEQRNGTDMNRLEARYELLRNDVQTARKLHGSLVEQQMATAATADLGPSNVRIVERASVPQYPSWPKLPLNLALGLVGGLVIGIGAAFARDYFDHSVHSSDEIQSLLRMPMLGTIPNFTFARQVAGLPALPAPVMSNGNGMTVHVDGEDEGEAGGTRTHGVEHVVLNEPDSPVAEAFRSMRTALLFTPARRPHVIVVTSARAAEGKTVTSLNLASALAQSGLRVLLMEADLRHPRCHRMLGFYTSRGLSNYLAGEYDDVEAMIHPVEPEGLAFLPSGPIPPNPAELLGSVRMDQLLRACRARYDCVVVDTPPVLPVTDAVVVGRWADGAVLVVKGNVTPRELVRQAYERLTQTGTRCLGTIVNNVDTGWEDPYAYDSYYGYRRGLAEDDAARGLQSNAASVTAWLRGVSRFTSGGQVG